MAHKWSMEEITSPDFDFSKVKAGDTYDDIKANKTYTFDGRTWVGRDVEPITKNKTTGNSNVLNTVMSNATPNNLVNGLQKGDSDYAAALRAQAEAHRGQQARAQVDAQRGYQLANRDARVEADKDAATRAASQFTQQMNQQSAASGGGAAVLASMNVQDAAATMPEHRARADTQFERATDLQTQAEAAEQLAIKGQAAADEASRVERDLAGRNLSAASLSKGGSSNETVTPSETTKEESSQEINAPQDVTPELRNRINLALDGAPDVVLENYPDLEEQLMAAIKLGPRGNPEGIAAWDAAVKGPNEHRTSFWPGIAWSGSMDDADFDPRFDQGTVDNRKTGVDEELSDVRTKRIINIVNRRF